MTAKTHILGGLLAGQLAIVAGVSDSAAMLPLLAGAAAGALVPDIDHRGSKISRSSVAGRVTSFAVSGVTKHRGVIHTPAFILACGAALGLGAFFTRSGAGPALLLGLLVGMLSHLLLDTLNPTGIMWLWPLSKKRLRLASIRTNSLGELLVMAALLAADLLLAARFLPTLLDDLMRLLP